MKELKKVRSGSGVKTIIHADHREGVCRKCEVPLVKELYKDGTLIYPDGKDKPPVERIRPRMVCPKCGELGILIARVVSIQAPAPPQCTRFKCLWKFVMDSLFIGYLSSYHRRRVTYAQKNRPDKGKKILEKYRTGEPAPKTLWQAIKAILILKFRR